MPTTFDYIVIGAGSGGIASARRAALRGAKVLIIEAGRLGGTCVNVGCVPKKVMWNAAHIAHHLHQAEDYGFNPQPIHHDWASLKAKRDAYITRLNGIYANNLDKSHVQLIQGRAQITGPQTVSVNGQSYQAPHILIAVGGKPTVPDIPGAEHGLTSDGFFELETLPKRIAIAGSGYIAVELAGLLHSLGSQVQLIIRKDSVLRSFDHELQKQLMEHMTQTGIQILTTSTITEVHKDKDLCLHLQNGDKHHTDQLIWAIGRSPNSQNLGLENVGIRQDKGVIAVDAYQQTNVPGFYAVGDVIGKVDLTPVAIAAGRQLAERLFGGRPEAKIDYTNIASVVFSHPPIGSIGLTESEAKRTYGETALKIYRAKFNNMFYAVCETKEPTFMKLITAGPKERIVGLHVIGMGADEMLQGFSVAIKMGACKADFDRTVAIHPVAAEEFVTMT